MISAWAGSKQWQMSSEVCEIWQLLLLIDKKQGIFGQVLGNWHGSVYNCTYIMAKELKTYKQGFKKQGGLIDFIQCKVFFAILADFVFR